MDVSGAWDFLNERRLFAGSILGGQNTTVRIYLFPQANSHSKENSIQQAARGSVPQKDTFIYLYGALQAGSSPSLFRVKPSQVSAHLSRAAGSAGRAALSWGQRQGNGEIRKRSVAVPNQKHSRGSLPKAIKFWYLYILFICCINNALLI